MPEDLKRSLLHTSISDKLELCNKTNLNLIRRIAWIPSDVGNSYFLLFPKHVSFYNFGNLQIDEHFDGIPNLVGNLVYRSKFPDSYLSTVRAYSSFLSDAYARFGLAGDFIAVALLLITRFGLFAFSQFVSPPYYHLYLFSLSGLFWLPMQASVQAILIAQGILPILLILALAVWVRPGAKWNNS